MKIILPKQHRAPIFHYTCPEAHGTPTLWPVTYIQIYYSKWKYGLLYLKYRNKTLAFWSSNGHQIFAAVIASISHQCFLEPSKESVLESRMIKIFNLLIMLLVLSNDLDCEQETQTYQALPCCVDAQTHELNLPTTTVLPGVVIIISPEHGVMTPTNYHEVKNHQSFKIETS